MQQNNTLDYRTPDISQAQLIEQFEQFEQLHLKKKNLEFFFTVYSKNLEKQTNQRVPANDQKQQR